MKTLLILSGKGGVGKSSICGQLALALHSRGLRVGVLDVDLCGPSMPLVFGVPDASIEQSQNGWVPAQVADGLYLMSINFLLQDKDTAILWRGPKKTAMISQFIRNVDWGHLDYLLIDTPPGTSDEHLAVLDAIRSNQDQYALDGAILVTTPQQVAAADVRKEYNFCKTVGIPVLGVIENMSGYKCPHCSDCTDIFSSGGGQSLSQKYNIPLLGKIPINPQLAQMMDDGSLVRDFTSLSTCDDFKSIASEIL
ncbi:hypothetical protein MP228_008134 [Amoeboaphelidium protococcarum]|nr:hypothetical protein MP228_008134 [Amoeboaphelidium protococcarum]